MTRFTCVELATAQQYGKILYFIVILLCRVLSAGTNGKGTKNCRSQKQLDRYMQLPVTPPKRAFWNRVEEEYEKK
jgi:hypothetical protein